MSRAVYATVTTRKGNIVRLGAHLASDPGETPVVVVWRAHGPTLGLYKLERFRGGKLTAATLRDLFTPEVVEPVSARKIAPARLVNAAGVAEMTGLTRGRISQLIADERQGFPAPLDTPGVVGIPLYDRAEVSTWFDLYRISVRHKRSSRFGPD